MLERGRQKMRGAVMAGLLGPGAAASAPTDHEDAPQGWEEYLRAIVPQHVTYPHAEHHRELWEHVWAVEPGSAPEAFVQVVSRGGGKSTQAELACMALGARGRRRYALYVCSTQDSADKHVATISTHLESPAVALYHPEHAERSVGKYGASKGWRRNRLVTKGGFVVDAAGLDTAVRGLKFAEQRPDLIILDDIDDLLDSPATIAKKISVLTSSILPAGSENVMVIAVQNLITKNGVFSRIVDGRADFLRTRIMSGPHPAVRDAKYEWIPEDGGLKRCVLVSGKPSWAGQSLEVCNRMIQRMGPSAFRRECQHEVRDMAQGIALKFDRSRHLQGWAHHEIRQAIADKRLVPFGGIDFGHWRFGFLLLAADRARRVHVLDEIFSQRQDLTTRARLIHELCTGYGIERMKLWGDSANPTDMVEINRAWKRGWNVGPGQRVKSRLRVAAVVAEGKARVASVERLNDALALQALVFRRELGRGATWMLGQSAVEGGQETVGSRLMWEVENWAYAAPNEGEAQEQDPDDDTADGADLISALRYGTMSWWKGAPRGKIKRKKPRNVDLGYQKVLDRMKAMSRVDQRRSA